MSLLLALETSTHLCSTALLREGRPLAAIDLQRPRIHAEQLPDLIEEVLDRADRSLEEIAAIALSEGPGSYTGLRIGASTAKGLAESRDLPLVPVPSLEALAERLLPAARSGDRVVTLRHARADEYFIAGFEIGADPDRGLVPRCEKAARIIEGPEIGEALPDAGDGTCWIAGAADDLPEALASTHFPGRVTESRDASGEAERGPRTERTDLRGALLPEGATAPSAFWCGRAGARRLAHGQTAEVETYEPAYGRAFQSRPPRSAVDRLAENS